MLTNIVFSKDRPCQLDAFLKSMKEMFPEPGEVIVLYDWSDEKYLEGYQIVQHENPHVIWCKEYDIRDDLRDLLGSTTNEYLSFYCDDNIWINPFSLDLPEYHVFQNTATILCYSLRMHPNVRKCQPMGNIKTPPPAWESPDYYIWKWKGLRGDWGYPMSIDGHIFRIEEIAPYVLDMPYTNVNEIEVYMSQRPMSLPLMVCAERSSLLNIPLNRVQTTNANVHMNVGADYLNEMFLKGYRIDVEHYYGFESISPHQEVELWLNPA